MKNILDKLKDFMIGPEYDEDEEEFIYDDDELEEPIPRLVKENNVPKTVRRERGSLAATAAGTGDKVVNIHNEIHMQIVIAYPKVVDDTSALCRHLKENKTLVVNLEDVDRSETQRIVDFLSGVAYALDGDFQSISNRIFIAAPQSVEISGQLKEELKSSGVIFPWVSSATK